MLKWAMDVNCLGLGMAFLPEAKNPGTVDGMRLICTRHYYYQEDTTLVASFCLVVLKAFSDFKSCK